MKILIIGHARHGKTTVADILLNEFDFIYKDSSMASAEIFIYDELKEKYNYSSFEECYEDRKQHREEWFNLICDFNFPDKARLAKEILKKADVYVGMRSNDELNECLNQNLFDLIIGVYRPSFPNEPETSFDINIWKHCDIIIPNDGTIDDLYKKVKKIKPIFYEE
jgi:hypothetical protein